VTFRARLALAAAAAVALAVVAASALVYVLVRGELRGQVDDSLRDRAGELLHGRLGAVPSREGELELVSRDRLGGADGYVQVVLPSGDTVRERGATVVLPVGERVLAVGAGRADPFLADAHVAGIHIRVLTAPYRGGTAIQVARPLTEADAALARIRSLLLVIAAGGVGIAVALGLAVSRAALAPVRRLTDATERVTATGDLSQRIAAGGNDELSRLASSFNTMLTALEDSTRAQRQLVADASHELRTPLTSLRTNIEVLAGDRPLPPGERRRLIADVVEQLGEMTTLVAELMALARGDRGPDEPEDVRLDLLIAAAVERTRRHRPGVEFATDLEESIVHGVRPTIERAVANLLDNAAKWSPPGGIVSVSVAGGTVSVRDHGPGIDDADLPHIFDRFYRAPGARGMPGSGLGLAIVRQVAEAHGGAVTAERAATGGSIFRLTLPAAPPSGGAPAAFPALAAGSGR
jgi:two-component system, OmpR family, sensor histidine kinase MprB